MPPPARGRTHSVRNRPCAWSQRCTKLEVPTSGFVRSPTDSDSPGSHACTVPLAVRVTSMSGGRNPSPRYCSPMPMALKASLTSACDGVAGAAAVAPKAKSALKATAPSDAAASFTLLRIGISPESCEQGRSPARVSLIQRRNTSLAGDALLPRRLRPLDGLHEIGVIADAAVTARKTLRLDAHFLHAAYDRDHGGIGRAVARTGVPQVGHESELRIREVRRCVNPGRRR